MIKPKEVRLVMGVCVCLSTDGSDRRCYYTAFVELAGDVRRGRGLFVLYKIKKT